MVLENNPDWVGIKTDISNAFNSVDRSALFKTVSESFADIACHVEQMYGRSNPMIFFILPTRSPSGGSVGSCIHSFL